MIATPVLVALAVAGSSLGISGALLSRRRHVRVCGVVLALAGLSVGAAVVALATGSEATGLRLLVFAGLILLPCAVLSYPHLGGRDPVEFVCSIVVVGGGLLGAVSGDRTVIATVGFSGVLALVAVVWWRLEHDAADRAALTWLAVGGVGVGLVAGTAVFAIPSTTTWSLVVLAVGLVGPCMWVGVTRPDVVDGRALAVGLAVAVVVATTYLAAYSSLVAVVELTGHPVPSPAALGLIGLVLAAGVPALARSLHDGIDQLLFGRRRDPLAVARGVVGEFGSHNDPVVALAVIQHALDLPYVALTADKVTVAAIGRRPDRVGIIALARLPPPTSTLVVGLRPGERRLRSADRRTLGLIVPLLEQTVRLSRVTAELQLARQDLVTALEEERRRVRRDLHDGLGPRLSGIGYTADAVQNLLREDPDQATVLLRDLRRVTSDALDEIRRIAYGMRPPALDELGLVAALQQQTRGLRTARNEPVMVTITASPFARELPAAVEVAAYRFVIEAVNNVAKHSNGNSACVSLSADDHDLTVTVSDNGSNDRPWAPGVGIVAMKERAAALGGTLTIGSGEFTGHIETKLPLRLSGNHREGHTS
ncbi:MAG TPA: histidine kinase [Microlunatus sp.]|nr:histidine kinase [Microlunatus sp.]